MKTTKFLVGAAFLVGIALSSCQGKQSSKLTNEEDSVSYVLGLSSGMGYIQTLKEEFPEEVVINKEILIEGFIQGFNSDTANYKFNTDEIRPFMESFFVKIAQQKKEKQDLENTKILYENSQKEGVKVTESGLQYKIITEGKGAIPTKDNTVKVHYTGKLVDGTVFDSSVERGQPVEFQLGRVIPGWTEALQLMPVGSKWELVIPSELGYGDRTIGNIPANSVLFFDVELLDIVPATANKTK